MSSRFRTLSFPLSFHFSNFKSLNEKQRRNWKTSDPFSEILSRSENTYLNLEISFPIGLDKSKPKIVKRIRKVLRDGNFNFYVFFYDCDWIKLCLVSVILISIRRVLLRVYKVFYKSNLQIGKFIFSTKGGRRRDEDFNMISSNTFLIYGDGRRERVETRA